MGRVKLTGVIRIHFEMMIIFCILIVVVIVQMQQLIKICRYIVYSLEVFIGPIK